MVFHKLIEGASFSDTRGTLHFCNEFNMSETIRFYVIAPSDTDIVRAWQGHRQEKKWFYCNSGAFIINLIKVDDFENPSRSIVPERFILKAKTPAVLEVTGGYATGLKAMENESKLMVFSNFNLEESKNDDFRYDLKTWQANW